LFTSRPGKIKNFASKYTIKIFKTNACTKENIIYPFIFYGVFFFFKFAPVAINLREVKLKVSRGVTVLNILCVVVRQNTTLFLQPLIYISSQERHAKIS